MSPTELHAELVSHLNTTLGIPVLKAGRVTAEMLAYFDESLEDFVTRPREANDKADAL